MNIENALRRLCPSPRFYGRLFTPEDYASITWADPRPKPTWDELVAADMALVAEMAADAQEAEAERARWVALRGSLGAVPGDDVKTGDLPSTAKAGANRVGGLATVVEQLLIMVAILERRINEK